MASRAMAITTVILRILTLLLAAGCMVVLILDKAIDVDGSKITFKDILTFRYLLATAVVAAAYSILQLLFAMYYACTEKRLIRGYFLPVFDFYADKVIAFLLLASAIGAGFVVPVEVKEFVGDLFLEFGGDLGDSPLGSFFNKGYLAACLLAGAFLCTAILSILPSFQRTTSGSRGFFF